MINIMDSTKMVTLTERDVQVALIALEDYLDRLRSRRYLAQADKNTDLAERLHLDIDEVRATTARLEAQL